MFLTTKNIFSKTNPIYTCFLYLEHQATVLLIPSITSVAASAREMTSTLSPLVGIIFIVSAVAAADLRVGFYDSTCPQAESIVRAAVHRHVDRDSSETAWILRMYFHDCFYTGCDASLLIRFNPNDQPSEQEANVSTDIRVGDLIIDDAKYQVEAVCPQTVSCADILALAARDVVLISSGGAINYSVPTGRRDSLSLTTADDVTLPEANTSLVVARRIFQEKNFTLEEMVTLLGGHSIGVAGCGSFRYRLFNFNGKNGTSDPNMDSELKERLASLCGADSNGTRFGDIVLNKDFQVALDQGTPYKMDNVLYQQLLRKKGLLQLDQELAIDESTAWLVKNYASNATLFYQKFAEALIKMGNLGVLTGDEGDIRKYCYKYNNDTKHGEQRLF